MKIKPILFNTEMVKAILEGRKTQTRRIIKPQPVWDGISCFHISKYGCWAEGKNDRIFSAEDNWPINTGDILWVRETWCNIPVSPGGHFRFGGRYYYKADGDIRPDGWRGNWCPSIHMPKEAARIFLRVKDVRVERLQDMTEDDAIAEGIPDTPAGTSSPLERFEVLWDKTIKRDDMRKFGYHANPLVWVIEFERCEKPEGWC